MRYPERVRDGASAQLMTRELRSAALGRSVRYAAYVPEHGAGRHFPLLFLLHGAESSHVDLCQHAHAALLQLVAAERVIVVLPEGAQDGWWLDSPLLPEHRYASHLMDEVLPDAALWLPGSERRSIGGISAGGNAAIVSALRHPGCFASVSSLSGALDLEVARRRPALELALGPYAENPAPWRHWSAQHVLAQHAAAARQLPLLLTVGASDLWAQSNRVFSAELDRLAVAHTFRESAGGHDWTHWLEVLPEHIVFHARVLNATR
jgi:S-formylglutathione hydrolase FrmB